MRRAISLIFLVIFFESCLAIAGAWHMTKPVWRSCGEKQCYSLSARAAGRSWEIDRIFAWDTILKIYEISDISRKPSKILRARKGLFDSEKAVWTFLEAKSNRAENVGQYTFDTQTFAIKKID